MDDRSNGSERPAIDLEPPPGDCEIPVDTASPVPSPSGQMPTCLPEQGLIPGFAPRMALMKMRRLFLVHRDLVIDLATPHDGLEIKIRGDLYPVVDPRVSITLLTAMLSLQLHTPSYQNRPILIL